jgi:hypothetical protein
MPVIVQAPARRGGADALAPKETPRAVIDKINADVREVLTMPDVVVRLATLGTEPSPMSPAEFDAIRGRAGGFAYVTSVTLVGMLAHRD